ncbi:hypothetical protein B0H14DRAFT_1409770 [Mycena olivaceomarginata]|nr:hypothetical protein B0H14DRAFT_1409770 [Mycena olivaceomarginata]
MPTSRSSTGPSYLDGMRERKRILDNDLDCSEVNHHSVFCNRCTITVNLERDSLYRLRPWKKHKDTGKHRKNGGTENVALNDYLHRQRGGRSRHSPASTYDMDMDCFPTSDGATATADVEEGTLCWQTLGGLSWLLQPPSNGATLCQGHRIKHNCNDGVTLRVNCANSA